MNQFFGTQYSQEDLQRQVAQRRSRNGSLRSPIMSMGPPFSPGSEDGMNMTGMMGGDTLDDIIMQNNKELQRSYSDRRSSMLEFGSTDGNLDGFQFAPPPNDEPLNLRRQSTGELEMAGYTDIDSGMNMQDTQMGFSASMQTTEPLSIDTSAFQGMSPDMVQGMMNYGSMGMDGIAQDTASLNMFSPTDFSQPFSASMGNIPNGFMIPGSIQDGLQSRQNSMHGNVESDMMPTMPGLRVSENSLVSSPAAGDMAQNMVDYSSPISPVKPNMSNAPTPQDPSYSRPSVTPSTLTEEIAIVKREPEPTQYRNIYSQSGFDMLGALIKVASRKDPEINIGKVDLSCAFVVCDITQADMPIIYVSDIFERLTGYNKHEVLGRNCRFLQSPQGKVQAGAKRQFVDNKSVYYLKERLAERKEAQRSLINYRKGGQPFLNLLTMIPITGEDDKEIRYYVGFQVDLVEKPTSVEAKGVNGMYTVDYAQAELPRYNWTPPENVRSYGDGGQTISRDDVSTVLSAINNNTESELTRRMWDKVLLENTDDVVHVLSLKGLFLYLSPSCRQVLEYDAAELVGTALSSICHPSDIVPVTRELKDTSSGVAVSVVYRIRRKRSGYTWFESHGSLCVEQGKGRKCIILVGRERPVYALSRHDIDAAGGIGENEMWTKLSTSGMFLFVSSNVRILLDRSPEELVGTSMQTLMRSESRVEFGRTLEKARTGKRVSYKHEILNKRGLVLQAQTTLYPGDATEGQKPTFLVAQTRLLKASARGVAPSVASQGSSRSMTSMNHIGDDSPLSHPSSMIIQDGGSTPMSSVSNQGPITQPGGAGLPIGSQDLALASEANIFDELKTTRCTSWQFELRQMEKSNRLLAEELASLLSNKKKRKRRKGAGHLQRDCANCHTRVTPEWRRGPSGQRDLCNSCGLRWAKQVSRSASDHNSPLRTAANGWSQSDSSTSRS